MCCVFGVVRCLYQPVSQSTSAGIFLFAVSACGKRERRTFSAAKASSLIGGVGMMQSKNGADFSSSRVKGDAAKSERKGKAEHASLGADRDPSHHRTHRRPTTHTATLLPQGRHDILSSGVERNNS